MKPFLFEGTWFEIPVYYAIYMLAFLGAILLGIRRAKAFDISPVRTIDAGIISFVCGLLGARLFHILIEYPEYYWQNPSRIFSFWSGGYVLYGGLILGSLGVLSFLRFHRENISRFVDMAVPCLFLGIGIGRMACLSAGCCYGKPTDLWWGIVFTHPAAGAPLHQSLHPTQMLESLFGFLMCVVFYFVWRRPRQSAGWALPWAMAAYACFRFSIEFLRNDPERGFWFSNQLSTSQFISLVLFAVALVWMLILYLRDQKSEL